jgi:uncharacterized protein (TIGR02246 family)
MKPRQSLLVLLLLLLGVGAPAWAGPAEEFADFTRQRAELVAGRQLEPFVATYADNAILTSALSPFRIEGKPAIQAHFAALFETYPTIRVVSRQPAVRFFNDGSVAVANQYSVITFVDRHGVVANRPIRSSMTAVKQGGDWLVVDQHNSLIPH